MVMRLTVDHGLKVARGGMVGRLRGCFQTSGGAREAFGVRSTIAVDDGDGPYERQPETTWMGAEHATGLVLCSRGFGP